MRNLASLGIVSLLIFTLIRAHAQGPAASSTPVPVPSKADSKTDAKPESKSENKPETVTRVVGEIGPRIVTSREVRMNEAIGQVLQGAPSLKRVLSANDPNFPNQVLKVLDEWTVYLEAGEIGSKATDKAEIQRLAKAVSEGWKSNSEWEKIEPAVTEIREIVERKLVAQNLERLKSDASLVNVTDAEALQYYKKNRLRFGNMPFENFKDNIKSALVRSQTERRLFEWRSVLRRKYRVRNFVGA
jgi:hypothetical protein